jgi:hypothetical protein
MISIYIYIYRCYEKDEEKESREFSGFLVRVEKQRRLDR